MKIQKQWSTNYTPNNLDAAKISHKIGSLLDNAVPKTILGMISTAEEHEDGLVFYKRWKLQLVDKHNYSIIDLYTKNAVYEKVSLLISALHMIFYVNKSPNYASAKDKLIYSLDQEYFRCLENIKQFKTKITTADSDRRLLFSSRLQHSYYQLDEIKTRLSKIY
jgi:hypothetical protein